MADEIGNPKLRAEFDSRALLQGAKDAGAKLKTTFEESNRNVEAIQRKATQRIQGLISRLNAEKPRRQMFELGQAVQHMGGMAKLSEGQVSRLTAQVNRLAAAGAKVPASLAGLTGGSKLGAAFASLTTGGGISGALSALGPSGVIAAGGLGVATVAAVKMANAVKALAAQAEEWQNVAEATGIGVVSVQKLGDYLEDAGFQAGDLTLIMKKLQNEIATGGKEFERYGISLSEIRKLAPEEQLRALAAAVMAIEDPTNRAAAATEFFGRTGAAKLGALAGIAKGAYEALDALTVKQVSDLKQVDDALDQAGRAWTNWSKRALLAMISVASGDSAKRAPVELGGKRYKPNMSIAAFNALTDPANNRFLDTSPLTLPDDPVAAARRKEQQVELDKALSGQRDKQKEIADLLEKQYASARKLAFEILKASQAKYPGMTSTLGGVGTLPGARSLGMGAMVGAQNYGFGLDSKGFVTFGNEAEEAARQAAEGAEKLEKAARKTETFFEGLSSGLALLGGALGAAMDNVLSVIRNVAGSFKGFGAKDPVTGKSIMSGTDKFNVIAGAAGQVGSLVGGTGGSILTGAAGGAMSGAAVGSLFGPAGAIIGGVVGGLAGAVGGYFAGRKAKKEAEEVAALIGTNFSTAQLAALKATAKSLGKDWRKYLQEEMQRAQDLEIAQAKRQNLEQGLGAARTAAESLMARMGEGGLPEALTAALQAIIGKVAAALLKSGLGILDPRLSGSAAFTGAQGMAGDVAGALGGMRQAGMMDAALSAAGGAAAGEIQKQAVEAALAAGLSPEEAAKAGSAAIAPLLREQLNASLQSGQKLDENTQALLDEAKKNGIDILADPVLESLDVQKKQLEALYDIRDKRQQENSAGKQSGPPQDRTQMPSGRPPTGAAKGIGPFISKSEGLIHYHKDELIWVLPASMRKGGIIHAAKGLYDDGEGGRGGRDPGGRSGGGSDATGGDASTGGPSRVVAEMVAQLAPILAKARPVTLNTTIAPTYNEDPTSSKERREDLRRFEHENLKRILRSRDPETVYLIRRALDMG